MVDIDQRKINSTGIAMAAMGIVAAVTGSFLGYYPTYALGVLLAVPVSWFLFRWQMMAVCNLEGLPPRKATNRLMLRSMLRLLINLAVLGVSILGGVVFLFGVLTGLLLQIVAHMGQTLITLKKGGEA
ncbi:MAG: hypothetical protein GX887_05260 [Firmicutes bacterium]|nr:hypothetical protein [Bacillota bacterium]